ncbi:hypothetical protein B0T24DRAFT_591808 [Lasiosphaeria ovina]|uniref:Uncharacterized protein n=1 Tax=Lasiosphaeria ovina TaxID=92902 RepID=A0AAE0NAE1_9PEZI|nr:hypothetical protein B0T24DRAFT_591808 [Lasiosphaeria ovina]
MASFTTIDRPMAAWSKLRTWTTSRWSSTIIDDFKQTRGEKIIRCTKLDFGVEDGAMVPSTPGSGCRGQLGTAGQVSAQCLLPKFREIPSRDNIFYLFIQPKPTPAAAAAAAGKSGLLWNNSHRNVYGRAITGGDVCWRAVENHPAATHGTHINPPAFYLVCPHCMNKIPQVAPKEEDRGCLARLARPYSKTIALATDLDVMYGAQQ